MCCSALVCLKTLSWMEKAAILMCPPRPGTSFRFHWRQQRNGPKHSSNSHRVSDWGSSQQVQRCATQWHHRKNNSPTYRQFTVTHKPQRWYIHQQCRGRAGATVAPRVVKPWSRAPGTPSVAIDGRGGYQTKGTAKFGENNLVMLCLQAPVNIHPNPAFGVFGYFSDKKKNGKKMLFSSFPLQQKQEHRLLVYIWHSETKNKVSLVGTIHSMTWKSQIHKMVRVRWHLWRSPIPTPC